MALTHDSEASKIISKSQKNFLKTNIVAGDGDHLVSLIDEISYKSPSSPMLSQIDDIPPEEFCHGDNRPPNCTVDCSCIHMIDLPLNAIVEIVLVGLYFFFVVKM